MPFIVPILTIWLLNGLSVCIVHEDAGTFSRKLDSTLVHHFNESHGVALRVCTVTLYRTQHDFINLFARVFHEPLLILMHSKLFLGHLMPEES